METARPNVAISPTCKRTELQLFLKPSGYHMYCQVSNLEILHSAHTVHVCVQYGSRNKYLFYPYSALSDWFV